MKIHSFKVEIPIFLVIFVFFVIPPITTSFSTVTDTFVFNNSLISPVLIIQFLLSCFILYFYKEKKSDDNNFKIIFYKKILPSTFTLSILFFVSLIFKYISVKTEGSDNTYIEVFKPDTFILWILCLINFLISAFYEEIIYRFYLSDIVINLIKNENKILIYLIEIIVLLLFAFAHFYSGWLAVLNAAIAHIVLRLCYKLTSSIFPGVFAHFSYNIISLILL